MPSTPSPAAGAGAAAAPDRAPPPAPPAGLPPTFWRLWAGWLVSALASFVFPFLAFFLTARGFSPFQVGLVVSLFGAGSVVAGPAGGLLADRIGRRPTILFALLGSAGAAIALAFLQSPPAVGAAVFLFGLASQAVNAPFQAIVADTVPQGSRSRAFELAYWARNVGASVSLVAGGYLAAGGWKLPFLLDAATTLAFALVVQRWVPETRPSAPASGAAGAGHGELLADRRFLALLTLHALFATALWQLHAGLPIDMAQRGVSPAAFGSVLALNTFMVALLQPFASRITGRFAPTTTLAAGALLVGLGYVGYAFCATAWHYAVATAVLTLGEIAYLPVVGALVADLAPPHLRGRYAGAFGFAFGLAGFLAPMLGSFLIQTGGAPTLWVASLAACTAVAAGYVALGSPGPGTTGAPAGA